MSFTLVFQPSAQAEIADAFAWYEGERPGLGHAFMNELERIERLIRVNPRLYARVEDEVRCAGLQRFPYGIYDVVEHAHVRVIACFHQHREPRSMSS